MNIQWGGFCEINPTLTYLSRLYRFTSKLLVRVTKRVFEVIVSDHQFQLIHLLVCYDSGASRMMVSRYEELILTQPPLQCNYS